MGNLMFDDRKTNNEDKFTFKDASICANVWVFIYTRIGYLTLIGVFLVIAKMVGWLGLEDISWINVLWPFIFIAAVILVVTLIYWIKHNLK